MGPSGLIRDAPYCDLSMRLRDRRGVTLTELMVSVAILSIGILGFIAAFQSITKAFTVTRARTLATNLAQEKIEALKNIPYYSLLITTASAVENAVSPSFEYDTGNYPSEIITIGGITFTRRTYVTLVQVNANKVEPVTYTYPDTGMKGIQVYVLWTENGVRKVWSLTNILENPNINPLDASFSGTVTRAGTSDGVGGVLVRVEQNPAWNTITNGDGDYSFRVYHGTYTIRFSSYGYYDAVSAAAAASAGTTQDVDASLTMIASGTIAGNAWMNTHLLISQVVSSTIQINGNNFVAQYVELYNPTTFTITIGGDPPPIKVNYKSPTGCTNADTCSDSTYGIKLTYVNNTVDPGRYYLIANTNTVAAGGEFLAADAYFADDADSLCSPAPNGNLWNLSLVPPRKLIINYDVAGNLGHGGSVWLTDSSGAILDAVGWTHNANIPPNCETSCIYQNITGLGLPTESQIVRIASPTSSLNVGDMFVYGRAYDSGNNPNDFIYPTLISGIQFPPKNTANAAKYPIAGTPALGSYVAVSSDALSGSTQTYAAYIASGSLNLAYATFRLVGVATGTWSVNLASGNITQMVEGVTVQEAQTTWIPTAVTTPSWAVSGNYGAFLGTVTTGGFVEGRVTDIFGSPVSGITVTAPSLSKTTNSNGTYFGPVASTGSVALIVNPNNANPYYLQDLAIVTVETAQITNKNFTLQQGGRITGYATSGTTPLPGIVFTATIGGYQYGAGTSDSSGYFSILNVASGTYTVQPVLEPGQDSNPNSKTGVVMGAGGVVFSDTFTVTGAFGSITGGITYQGSALTSGALVIASSASIASTPSAIYASSSPASTVLYSASSKADGTYEIQVRGSAGYDYSVSVYVPTISDGSVTITTKTYSGVSVSAGQATTLNITVP